MPIPKPKETKEDFIRRCIPYVINNGEAKNSDHAYAICNGIWETEKKLEQEKSEQNLFNN